MSRDSGGAFGVINATQLYSRMGLLAQDGPVPFVGNIGFLAGVRPDSTLVVVTVSLANRALAFTRESDRYRAAYDLQIDLHQAGTLVRHVEGHETVRVASYKETTRGDESVIYQQVLTVAPGQYVLGVSVRDVANTRSAKDEAAVAVPRFDRPALSSAFAVFEATPRTSTDSAPRVLVSPRATAVFGRDSTVTVYLEGYGGGARLPIALSVRGDRGGPLWRDTVSLPARRAGFFSGTVAVPVSRIGVGVLTLTANRIDSPDSVRAPIFVGFGDELPVASFDEMLSYLRYFTTPARLKMLRDTTPEDRPAAWAAFLRETDPVLSTPQHEGLRDYFSRLQQANLRFREEGIPGWMTDRGMAFASIGEPDRVYEQGSSEVSQRGRAQVWEYQQYNTQLVFIDQTGFGRWRLTTSSDAELQSIVRRMHNEK